jgi:hypothetical protein
VINIPNPLSFNNKELKNSSKPHNIRNSHGV